MSRFFRFVLRFCVVLFILMFIVLNVLAYGRAWNMTHYVAEGQRPPKIESMSWPEKIWVAITGIAIPKIQNKLTPNDVGLTYEVRHIPSTDGISLEAWWVPTDKPRGIVLLFHGFVASKESMLQPAAALNRMGFSTLLVDFRGAGGSDGNQATLGVREAADVAATVRYTQGTWPNHRIIIYGFSMGTVATLHAVATEGIQPDAVILEAPFDTLLNVTRNPFRIFGFPSFPTAELLVFWGSVQNGYNGFEFKPAEDARTVKCPVLVFHGESDTRVTDEQARVVFEDLNGGKKFVSVPGVEHELVLVHEPELWKQTVAEFLAGFDQNQ